ncbi:DUF6090 family protein [Aestuariivivens sediminicola]|uniref:DUF6090 family protein n=1 Tax=Aestuariivivens sediminicola TaxID=2913560 RepID=UPI001F5A1126|nr:DUF6090 family protein [Aestuariivivens sediminicola]
MIKFFRRIRQRLLSENKFRKYLIYAIGEIILVVIGILIALQINNWNNYNIDRVSERDYLKRISNDLKTDTLNFSRTINALKIKQESLGTLLELIKNGQIKAIDSTTIIWHIKRGNYFSIAHPGIVNNTFEELKNTGGMEHVRSTILRSAINNYYFEGEHRNDRIEKKRKESDFSFIIHHKIPGLNETDGVVSYRNDLVSYKEILDMINSYEFKKIVISEYNIATFILKIQEDGYADSKVLLNLVGEELNEK